MAPLTSHYDYLVIGGGSGGVASARRAASLKAKTLLIEGSRLGGTCVNVGCVPKKVMWAASDMATKLHQADAYGFKDVSSKKFDWPGFTETRNAYVERLNGIYARNLEKEGVEYVFGWAKFKKASQSQVKSAKDIVVEVDLREGGTQSFTADKILIASGGTAIIPQGIEGAELGVTSDGFFDLSDQPKSVAIVGAGYIGVEFAGVFNGLGSETHLIIRGDTVLRSFDPIIQNTITDTYVKHGVHVHKKSNVKRVEKSGQQLKLSLDTGHTLLVDKLIWTIGRKPLHESLNLDVIGVKSDDKGYVIVDEYQNTTTENVFSVGDVTGHVELTPVAIAAGRKLSMRLFGGPEYKQAKLNYENVPSVVFSHPEAGSIGLTEAQARDKFGDKNIRVYQSTFTSMYYAPMKQEDKEPTAYKIVVNTADKERVVGLHIVGDSSAEILQGFGVAIKMGATKADFDNVVAIHPTSAEELVTMK